MAAELLVPANTAMIPVDLGIAARLERPETRIVQETLDLDTVDLHNNTLGTHTWSFTPI